MTTEPPLPRRAEALLREFTKDPDRDWDAQAREITEKLAQVALGSTPDELLAAPDLGVEPGEPTESAEAAKTPASGNPLSLSELARSIAQKPRTAHEALMKQSLATAAAARANPPTPKAATPAAAAPPPVAAQPVAAPSTAQPPLRERSSLRSFLAGAGVAIAAGIAATLMRPSSPPGPTPVAAEATPAVTAAVPALPQKPALRAAEPPSEQQARAEAPPAGAKADPAPEPAAPPEAAAPRAEQAPVAAAKPAAPAPAPAPASPAKSKRAATASEPVVLEDAMATVAGPAGASTPKNADESARLRPASAATSNTLIVDRPSPGAAQAAIGSVLGAARACVAGLTGASTASVVFNSEGGVSKVTLSGPAAGTPAGQCVESALRRARVAPFSQPSYVVSGIAIRP